MKTFPLRSDLTSLALTETGAHLSDVTFTLPGGRKVSPTHTAPWADEPMPDDTPPMLRVLRGDFLCAPFGDSDVIPTETRPHGGTANGTWRLDRQTATGLEATLEGDVMGASVSLHLELRPGENMVYQRHSFTGGKGRLPIGHHAMLRADQPLELGFAPWTWAGTPPEPIEVPPAGRSVLAYPQEIADLRVVRRTGGGTADITHYPFDDGHEDVLMLVADRAAPFAWTAATCAEAGWVWFALKNPRELPATTLWLSNGGRTYAPWSSRHRRVIGLEEICGYFHLGHAASIGDNPLAARGTPTAITLGAPLSISYAFGLAPVPSGFGAVATIVPAEHSIRLIDGAGRQAVAACDLSFITGTSPEHSQ